MSIPTDITVIISSTNNSLPPVIRVDSNFYKVQNTTTVSQES
jgi:hypothetical protein